LKSLNIFRTGPGSFTVTFIAFQIYCTLSFPWNKTIICVEQDTCLPLLHGVAGFLDRNQRDPPDGESILKGGKFNENGGDKTRIPRNKLTFWPFKGITFEKGLNGKKEGGGD
jgi:hypothetical protein